MYAYCDNNPVINTDPSGHFTILALVISIGINLAFEVIEDAIDGGVGDGSHDWRDYLGAGISGFFGGLGGGPIAQIAFSVAGGLADAALSGGFEEDGFWNTMGSIALSTAISFGTGTMAKRFASNIKASSLKKLSNNVANRQLKAIGARINIGSNVAKAKGGGWQKQ